MSSDTRHTGSAATRHPATAAAWSWVEAQKMSRVRRDRIEAALRTIDTIFNEWDAEQEDWRRRHGGSVLPHA